MTPPLTPEFLAVAVSIGTAATVAFYMAGRHNRSVASEFNEPELEGTDMEQLDLETYYEQNILPDQERHYDDLVSKLRAKARELAQGGREITSDDIHEAMPLPQGIDGRVMGAAFFPRKDWSKTGYQPSRRKENHGRPIARWRLREAA